MNHGGILGLPCNHYNCQYFKVVYQTTRANIQVVRRLFRLPWTNGQALLHAACSYCIDNILKMPRTYRKHLKSRRLAAVRNVNMTIAQKAMFIPTSSISVQRQQSLRCLYTGMVVSHQFHYDIKP